MEDMTVCVLSSIDIDHRHVFFSIFIEVTYSSSYLLLYGDINLKMLVVDNEANITIYIY